MRTVMLLLSLLVLASCKSATRVPEGSDVDAGVPYAAATFHPKSCPPRDEHASPSPRSPTEGCQDCKVGEHCKEVSSHGQIFGMCARNQCEKDDDCSGSLCACGPPNECVPGNCRGPEDCGGRECAQDRWRYGHGRGSFCRTKDDTCRSHEQCGEGKECAYVGRRWTCRKEVPAPPPG